MKISLPVLGGTASADRAADAIDPRRLSVAMLGPPNVGKSTLFNRLCGVRVQTANHAGTTQGVCRGCMRCGPAGACSPGMGGASRASGGVDVELVDLPGTYDLDLPTPEAGTCGVVLTGSAGPKPDRLLIVAEASRPERAAPLLVRAREFGLPTVLTLNMADEAARDGYAVDTEGLAAWAGVPVVLCSGRTGEGVEAVRRALDGGQGVVAFSGGVAEAERALRGAVTRPAGHAAGARGAGRWRTRLVDAFEGVATGPVLGVALLLAIGVGALWALLKASEPMTGWIEGAFAAASALAEGWLPAGMGRDVLTQGVLPGVGGVLVFAPQIFLTLVGVALLEHTGYLSRAVVAVDRLLRPFGLSGHAFVPLLSAHACAVPAIVATRGMRCGRDRLAAILAIPFMSCPARLPVYVLLTAALFPASPAARAAAVVGCYALGAAAGLLTALLVRRTAVRGETPPLLIELPPYRVPSVRTALLAGWLGVRGFLVKAGTLVLVASVGIWALGAFPRGEAGAEVQPVSALERVGRFLEPALRPLGADHQLAVGILASFAAREVFVSTMAVQAGLAEDLDVKDAGPRGLLLDARRDDGTRVFSTAASWSMLVFYVLSIQCTATLVTTARETGGWKWAVVQMVWMLVVSYAAAAGVFALAS